MSLSDRIHEFLTGATPEDRARHEETRRSLKEMLEKSIEDLEQEIDQHNVIRDPDRNIMARPFTEYDQQRHDRLVDDLERERQELRNL